MRTLIEARGLTKTFGATPALRGVDLDVSTGESVAVMGPSGSGKTTLLHVLAGITRPDAGTVRLHRGAGVVDLGAAGEKRRSELRRTSFGFVFQQGLLVPELTVLENVALPLLLNGVARTDAAAEALRLLASLGIGETGERRVGELSGGQQQRVAIARAQAVRPAVVFADEPTGALDSVTSGEVMTALLASTVNSGRALIVVTHDEAVAARCGRVLRMRDGMVVAESGAPAPAAAGEQEPVR
ncbi:ABC transporter ATP-binding protein [Gryllotalpicola ginsengisoli]|uniref:ABC transporter ATP-binding protein n=1 Tax=Gryllotalpicola ginsengisoli TaxID=444608 RepID=UPI0003B53FB3|nr:ABC transporter ATP-binding protein [Gryllotalpicola ginsengisoli]